MTAARPTGAHPSNSSQTQDTGYPPDIAALTDNDLKAMVAAGAGRWGQSAIIAFADIEQRRGAELSAVNPTQAASIFDALGTMWRFCLQRHDGDEAFYMMMRDEAWSAARTIRGGGHIDAVEPATGSGVSTLRVVPPSAVPALTPAAPLVAKSNSAPLPPGPPPSSEEQVALLRGTESLKRAAAAVKTKFPKLLDGTISDYAAYTEALTGRALASKDEAERRALHQEVLDIWIFARCVPRLHQDIDLILKNCAAAQSYLNPPEAAKASKTPVDSVDADEKVIRERVLATRVSENSDVHWEDIAGMEGTKKELRAAVVLPRILKELYTKRNKARGIMLYGPSGTGKTMLIKGLVNLLTQMQRREEQRDPKPVEATLLPPDDTRHIAGINLFCVTGADVNSMWVGQGEKFIKTLFSVAREMAPSLIFFDEVETLLRDRSQMQNNASHAVFTQFLQGADGFQGRGDVLLVAATNAPWLLDNAATRRFNRPIYVRLPDAAGRAAILAKKLESYTTDITAEQIATLARDYTEEFSGSDIEEVVGKACESGPMARLTEAPFYVIRDNAIYPSATWVEGCQPGPIEEIDKKGCEFADLPITFADLASVCENTRPSNDIQIDQFEKYAEGLSSKAAHIKDKIGHAHSGEANEAEPAGSGAGHLS